MRITRPIQLLVSEPEPALTRLIEGEEHVLHAQHDAGGLERLRPGRPVERGALDEVGLEQVELPRGEPLVAVVGAGAVLPVEGDAVVGGQVPQELLGVPRPEPGGGGLERQKVVRL